MRVQSAIVQHLQRSTMATYAIVGERTYWNISAKDPVLPFVRVRKAAHRPLASGMQGLRLPAQVTIEIVGFAKTQAAAADLADAVATDLIAYNGTMPDTSPATAGAIHVYGVEPTTEEDLVSEEAAALNIFAESREYLVDYR